jgi:6-pyruvoyltetrahydropterin/6-carboxytetrahydropterin synthase
MFEISKQFWFDAAHTLQRDIDSESSRRVHGHSYRAEVTVRGEPAIETGMVIDLGLLDQLMGTARQDLDHRLLDDVDGLGPATMENLARWIWLRLAPTVPGLTKVTIHRASGGETCAYYGEDGCG